MSLSGKQKRELRARAHALKPVVVVGSAGVTEELLAEVDRALDDHGLIKIRVSMADRDRRASITKRICRACQATAVQSIGHVAVLFRDNQKDTPQ